MSDWQDIETAPKMRTILLFAWTEPFGDRWNYRMATGYFHTGYEDEPGAWVWEGRRLEEYDRQPTHWQPLTDDLPPEPPTSPAKGKA